MGRKEVEREWRVTGVVVPEPAREVDVECTLVDTPDPPTLSPLNAMKGAATMVSSTSSPNRL